MLTIDSIRYQADVLDLSRQAEFLDKFANRSEDGVLHRQLLGVYFNYQLKLHCDDPKEYARLWQKLTEPEEFHTVVVPCEDGEYMFEAYFSSISDRLLLHDRRGRNHWTDLAVKFTAKAPARR